MKLMTKEIEDAFRKYGLYSQDGKGGESKVVVKYFGGSAATWLITEGEKAPDGDWTFFGLVTLGLPDPMHPGDLLWEWGYVSLRELERLRFPPFGLPAERDVWVKPGKTKVKDHVFMTGLYGGRRR
jgi:hypothetical protein